MLSLMMMNRYLISSLIIIVITVIFVGFIIVYAQPPRSSRNVIKPNTYTSKKYLYVPINEFDNYLKLLEANLLMSKRDKERIRDLFKDIRRKLESNKEEGMYQIKEALYYQLRDLGEAVNHIKKVGVGDIRISVKK